MIIEDKYNKIEELINDRKHLKDAIFYLNTEDYVDFTIHYRNSFPPFSIINEIKLSSDLIDFDDLKILLQKKLNHVEELLNVMIS